MRRDAQKRQLSSGTDGQESESTAAPVPSAFERHFTVAEIASMWNFGEDAVRRLFKGEAGVLVLGGWQPRGRKRGYKSLRIPESVVARVHSRMSL
jgi:hypothetical protein